MSKVLLVTPPYKCWGVQVIGTWPPLHLTYLAGAAVEAGHETRIFDAMNRELTHEDVRAEIERYQPDVVVTLDYLPVTGAIATATVPSALKLLNIAKEVNPEITTVLGGPHPTFMYDEILGDHDNRVDFILRGEMEATFPELLGVVESGGDAREVKGLAFRADGEIVATPVRPHIEDLDAIKPAWDLLDWSDYHYNIEPWGRMASVLTSRGCMMGCSFCSHRQFWRGDWRSRTPENVMEEIRELTEVYEVEFITLIDPYPTHDRERWEHLLDLLIAEDLPVHLLMETRVEDVVRDADILHKYRDAKVIHLYLGAESSTDEMLASLNKGTSVDLNKQALDLAREHDIMTEASFMVGGVDETPESIQKTIEVAIRLNPDIAVFPVLTPMPFTPLHEELKDRIREHDYSKYNLATPIVEPYAMTREEVMIALGKCYMTFYANKMREVITMPDGFKKRYMLGAFREMMKGYKEFFEYLGVKMPKMPKLPGVKVPE